MRKEFLKVTAGALVSVPPNASHDVVMVLSKDILVVEWSAELMDRDVAVSDILDACVFRDVLEKGAKNQEIYVRFADRRTHL